MLIGVSKPMSTDESFTSRRRVASVSTPGSSLYPLTLVQRMSDTERGRAVRSRRMMAAARPASAEAWLMKTLMVAIRGSMG
jgi:hypothetical protein